MSGRASGPCEIPDPDHDGEVHFYRTGWRCDAHSPWALKGLPQPVARRAPAIYTYRAAPAADENGTT
ncbi:hypothetical protein [Streptomyces olivaceus]|uniref:hypothetical protein n=1 Tax=Streptomyces olivaceus TaxID=47716 RepID=UPI0022EDC930|nr:hypothetical protein [Streptomyces olivaceus]GHI91312.1 hypothetical protein TPA0905_07830 [Streptomyces olivaceus]